MILRAVAWMQRFQRYLIQRFLHREPGQTQGLLQATDIKAALYCVIVHVQGKGFRNEINELKSKGHVSNSSCLFKLFPFLQEGVLRLGQTETCSCSFRCKTSSHSAKGRASDSSDCQALPWIDRTYGPSPSFVKTSKQIPGG